MSLRPQIPIIVGPTGSGKTALALRLAGGQPVSIIAADSRQVYRGLDIVTGKDIPSGFVKKGNYYERGGLRLFGFDIISPTQTLNAAKFSDYVRPIISQETMAGRRVVIVGGTGFYLKALTDPGSLASVLPNEKLRQELNSLSLEELQWRLKKANPDRFTALNRSDVQNPRRLIRAIEIASAHTGSVLASHKDGPCRFIWIGLQLPLDEIKQKIALRVLARLAAGALDEARSLQENYPDRSLPIYTTLGLSPMLAFLNGEIGHEEMVGLWIRQEYQYAKRQLVWFKKQPRIIWYDQYQAGKLTGLEML